MHRRLAIASAVFALSFTQSAFSQTPPTPDDQGGSRPMRALPASPAPDSSRSLSATGSGKVYKSVDAQGRVTYSSMPQPGAHAVEPKPLPSGIAPYQSAAPARSRPAEIVAPAPAPVDRLSAISQAQNNLKAAQAAQAQGVAPLAGERIATGNGGTRFSPAYDQRQAELAGNVQKAQKDLQDAQNLP